MQVDPVVPPPISGLLPPAPLADAGATRPPAPLLSNTIPTSVRPLLSASKPQTPTAHPSRSSTMADAMQHSSSQQRRQKPTFTTCLSYPEPAPSTSLFDHDEPELQRNQRRSKVEAISKLDRAGMPISIATNLPQATSFLPAAARQASADASGPSPSRNPLHHPRPANPPFSLDSVRTKAPRHAPPRSGTRLFGLQDCPVYHPSAEQFRDPLGYISSISREASKYGICKIVPPEGWRMPFSLETDTFRFKTRLQRLNSLEAASRAKLNFLDQLTMYHLQQGDSKVHIPVYDRKPVDLWQLRKEVNKLGGLHEVNRMQGWPVVAQSCGYDSGFGPSLKATYLRIIHPFDMFANRARSMSGSPLTPILSTNASKAPPGFVGESPGSPTLRTGPNGRMGRTSPRNGRMTRASPAKPMPLPFAPNGHASHSAPAVPTIKVKVPGFSKSSEGSDSELSEEEPPPPKYRKVEDVEYQKGEVCEVCRGGHAAEKILLCDGCDRGFHIYCLDPPLASVPTNEEWYCTPCLLSQGDDFGFEDGEEHSIPSFQARDAAFAFDWWNRHKPAGPGPSSPRSLSFQPASSSIVKEEGWKGPSRMLGKVAVSEDDVEREFWRLAESQTETVEVEYGADVHSTTHGSAAPTLETHPLDPYTRDGWNLNNMPILRDSLLRYIKSDISGMTVPWIYLGMLFSTFCWHNEDHYTYSVNYMYWGETKTWYGIPGSDADKFEAAMKSEAPELFEQQPGLLFQLVTMMNPGRLSEQGVKVVACDQRPNEFVITWPKAYHCGFNHGINFNEAVNFALPDWLPMGRESVVRYKQHSKAPVFSLNELLVTITLFSDSIKTAIWLEKSLEEMVHAETRRRDGLRALLPALPEMLVEEDCPEEQYQCCVCKSFCYLSQVTCPCTPLVACLDHATQLCGCANSKLSMRKRYSDEQLEEILQSVQNKAQIPEQWRERYKSLIMSAARPALKSMRALLAEGERIDYPMKEVRDLRRLVDRANGWVERVTALTTRKSTGRRRKGGRQETEEEDAAGEGRSLEVFESLLREVDKLAFDAPEIPQLRHVVLSIQSFRSEASSILSTRQQDLDLEKCRTALILGQGLNVDLDEIGQLEKVVRRLEWEHKVGFEVDDRMMEYDEVVELLQEGRNVDVEEGHQWMVDLNEREIKGRRWLERAEALLGGTGEIGLDEVDALVQGQEMTPISGDAMRQLEGMRKTATSWQASALQQLGGSGTSTGAQRLCKAVRSAQGALGRVRIPEVDALQGELDRHAKWLKELGAIIGIQPKAVANWLTSAGKAIHNLTMPEDDRPNDLYACFCRQPPLDDAQMLTCQHCKGTYHPRCVGISAAKSKNLGSLDKNFNCAMCAVGSAMIDDRPSLNDIASMADKNRYPFLLLPAELALLHALQDDCMRFARFISPVADPLDMGSSPSRDAELLQHLLRKMFELPVCFDAVHGPRNQRVVFEQWLQKRLHDARNPAKARTRPKKPKLLLREARPGEFACLCGRGVEDSGTMDVEERVRCGKCDQGWHVRCVKASREEGKSWRCPCCTVKEGKYYHRGVDVRVQFAYQKGTDRYVDYRTTINTFATSPVMVDLPRPASWDDVILLEATKFQEPVVPDDYEPPAVKAHTAAGRKPPPHQVNGNGHVKASPSPSVNGHPPPPPAISSNGDAAPPTTATYQTLPQHPSGSSAYTSRAPPPTAAPPAHSLPTSATSTSWSRPAAPPPPHTPRSILDYPPRTGSGLSNQHHHHHHPFGIGGHPRKEYPFGGPNAVMPGLSALAGMYGSNPPGRWTTTGGWQVLSPSQRAPASENARDGEGVPGSGADEEKRDDKGRQLVDLTVE